jgi:hypothetical protein
MITELNKETVTQIRNAVNEALTSLQSIGVNLHTDGIKYAEGGLFISVKGYLTQCSTGVSGEQAEFERRATVIGVPSSWYGKTVATEHGPATIREIETKKRKYPIIIHLDNGRKMAYTIDSVRNVLARNT